MKKFLFWVWCCVSFMGFLTLAWGNPCKQWGQPRVIGSLDISQFPEASGIAASKKFNNRLYHVNDSDNDHGFIITDLQGRNARFIRISSTPTFDNHYPLDATVSDFEDLGVGPCFVNDSCLFIGDIGDNRGLAGSSIRKTIQILVIKEEQNPLSWVRPVRQIILAYPDGPHDAEGLALHPNGDIFVLTKEINIFGLKALPAQLYKVGSHQWKQSDKKVIELTKVGSLDIPHWVPPHSTLFGQVVTSLDISPDGKRFLVLTYDFAIEVFRDLSESDSWSFQDLQKDKDFRVINLLPLPQPEGITYLPETQSFLYHTEFSDTWFRIIRGHGFQKAPPGLIRVDCAYDGTPEKFD